MVMGASSAQLPPDLPLPSHRDLYYGGGWRKPKDGGWLELTSPGTGESLGTVAVAGALDAEAAIAAAQEGFHRWRRVAPLDRAKALRRIAAVLRANAKAFALIDAADCGNPVREMIHDAEIAASGLEFFAGLVTEMKGASIPMGPGIVNFSVREPLGVVVKLNPFNHPLMFCAYRSAAALAAGNSVIVKPPEQAPLSSLRFAELIEGILPDGVLNVLPGGREAGAILSSHPGVAKVALIGSVSTGRAVMRSAAATVKPVMLELGGKNALIAFPDANVDKVSAAVVAGMNFTWCGQSCGSTSRAFLHESIHDAVLDQVKTLAEALKPGLPTDMATNMGALVSKEHCERVLGFIDSALQDGARLVCGGRRPSDPALAAGCYIEPTVFADVTPGMRVASEEIFGPVLSVLRWNNESEMIRQVNALEYGLTCAIWTNDLNTAHRTAADIEAGYIWINGVSRHFPGAPFGGYKQSGLGREEGIEELISYTQEKNINITVLPRSTDVDRAEYCRESRNGQ